MFGPDKGTPPPSVPKELPLGEGYLPQKQEVSMSPRLWACAWWLALARTNSNKGRAQNRNRGKNLNIQGDWLGAIGELFVYFQALKARRQDVFRHMEKHLFNPRGGRAVSGVLDAPGIDVKSFGCDPHKRYIATNAHSHRAQRKELSHYYFVLVPFLGHQGLVSRLVPWEDISSWEEKCLGYGDPSYNLEIPEFLSRYCSSSDLSKLRKNTHKKKEIKLHLKKAKEIMTQRLPSLRQVLT
jgi:hypothetical protein